ncbi:MAG: EAL domain-containing protein [Rubrivivax sp.]|nr:EAL domain-containing protein [Rubrivivax sp.]
MPPANPCPDPDPRPPAGGGLWARFVRRHLHDYPPGALAIWLALGLAGALALLWALWAALAWPATHLAFTGAGLVMVALAAWFPLRIPRSRNTVLVADVFIYGLMAAVGPAAAMLAAGLEAAIGALRSSRRLSTHLSGPAAALAAMGLGSAAFRGLEVALPRLGLAPEVATLAALCCAAPLPVMLTTGSLMSMIAAKQGRRLGGADWIAAWSWIAAMSLGSAFLAGLAHLVALQHGPAVYGVGAVLVAVLVLLLRTTLDRIERDRQQQEARVSDAERDAAQSQQRFMAAFTHAAIGMAIVRPNGQMLQVNRAFCALLGRTEAALVDRWFDELLHDGDAPLLRRRAAAVLAGDEPAFSMELRCPGPAGSELWVALHCSRYEDPGGAGHCLIHQLHDITSRHVAERRLQHIAYHDGLTDLANRSCFHERLALAVERSSTDARSHFAVMFLDLDRFKIVNDSLGHIAGNELLQEVARRLLVCVRPEDLVARLGGDEFAILLENLKDPEAALRLAHRVLASLCKPMYLGGTEVVPGASIGVTFSDLGYRTVDEVLRDADLAMYEAKAGGRGRVALFDTSMHTKVAEKLALESDLRRAIGEGSLTVMYQPIFRLEPLQLSGFEALVRWTHPERGPISPAVFIALAEEAGHIETLTDWVIDQAVAQLSQWQRRLPGTDALNMHVNISSRDLARDDLTDEVRRVLQRHGVRAEALTLEITETTLMGRLDVALRTMNALRDAGVRFSIDDFGTGYSSLAYLGTLPIDSLKIDRSFVMGLHEQPQNVAIVRSVVTLGQALGRRVVAEGIETPEQLAQLRQLGVPLGQGFLLSRPLKPAQVVELLTVGVAA